jgi:flagellin-like protein
MKGISPLVASVLLIAITMSIAGILAYWVSTYTTSTLPSLNKTKTEEECRFSNFEIYTCNFNTTTGTITFTLHNIGLYEIVNLASYVVFTNDTITPSISLNGTLATGEFKSYSLLNTTTNVTSTTFSKLIVASSACPGLSKEHSCTRS